MSRDEAATSTASGAKTFLRAGMALGIFVLVLGGLAWLQPDDFLLYVKAFHVVAVIAWMAGLLYLPRLFVYHSDAAPGSEQSETFKVMERRLLKAIMNPAMMIAWVLGLYLAWQMYDFQGGWLHAKIGLVLLMTLFHMRLSAAVRTYGKDGPRQSQRYWRLMNEIPTLLMIVIVILVIVKPF